MRLRPLHFQVSQLPGLDGHQTALRLKGDWLVVAVGDGRHTGLGEISPSNQDASCAA